MLQRRKSHEMYLGGEEEESLDGEEERASK